MLALLVSPSLNRAVSGGGRGLGTQENRRREGYGRRERKKQEVGKKSETLIFIIQQCIKILSKTRNQNIFDLYLTSQSLLSKQANRNLRLG